MRKIFLQTITLLFYLSMASSCVDDIVDRNPSQDTEKLVSFVVNIAGANSSNTRVLTEDDENSVKTVEVLLFDENGKYVHQPIFSSDIVQKGPNEIAFTMRVPEGTFNMVILANARGEVISLLTKFVKGMSKESILNLLITENTEKWNVTANSSDYKLIPMSGDIPSITVQGDNTTIKGVMLVRMLSKIDVNIATDVRKHFNLTSVHLYNNTVKGKIVPNTDSWNINYDKVVKPSIPESAQNPNLGTALIYKASEIQQDETGAGVSCLNTIYTFEANKGVGDQDMYKNTCLVVGGKYNGDTKDTYYRVDFVSAKSDNKQYLPLLRNHQYRVHITAIKGEGFDDPEIAFESRPINIEASVVEWNDGDINDIVFDGQYLLGVSQSEFTFTKEERTTNSNDNDLYIITDYPAGWNVSKITNDKGETIDWLKLSPTKGGTTKTKTKILVNENNLETERVGFIYITAGRLSHVVKVIQSVDSEFYVITLNIGDKYEIDGLDFISIDGKDVVTQQFNIVWRPMSLPLFYQITPLEGEKLVWDRPANEGLDDLSKPASPIDNPNYYHGHKNYTIRPIQFTTEELKDNPFIVRSEMVTYSITDGEKIASKPFLIRHIAKNIIPIIDDSYNLDGATHQFHVRSNMPYQISVKQDDKNVLQLITTKGKEDTSPLGYPIQFELRNDEGGEVGDTFVTLLLTSPLKEFDDKEVIINCTSKRTNISSGSNSYMVKPNGAELLIPVSRCNEWVVDAYNGGSQVSKLGEDEDFFAHLVWTDNSNGIAVNSVLESIGVKGKGPKGYLVVKPGAAEGNAVVAIKNGKGEILWSWHIWNTTYSPTETAEPGDYMDRNLGALTASISTLSDKPETYGLMYQWGRKDPFPSSTAAKMGTSKAKPLYDKDGNSLSALVEDIVKVLPQGSIHNNLHRTVLNPDVFYYNTDTERASGDWFTSFDNEKNNNLWNPDKKSIYDPCPEGWKTSAQDWSKVTFSYYGTLHQYSISFLGKLYVGGFRAFNSGKYEQENLVGLYWTSNPDMVNRFIGGDSGKGGIYNTPLERASGAMVRCIRESDSNE